MATRTQIIAEFDLDRRGIICNPGRFEGEYMWTPYFYDRVLEGDGDTLDWGDGSYVDVVTIDTQDRTTWPELDPKTVAIAIETNSDGFIACTELTQARLDHLREQTEASHQAIYQEWDA